MSDLLAEVDEIMRQERLAKIWHDHGKMIIAAIAAIILGTAAWSGYSAWDQNVKIQQTAEIKALLESPDFPSNIDAETLGMRGGAQSITLITAAGAHLNNGENDKALALYQTLSAGSEYPKTYRQLAALMQVRLQANQGENLEQLIPALEPIWNDQNSPWRFHAHLEAAALEANLWDNYERALEHLKTITDANALPPGFKDKARNLAALYRMKHQTGQEAQ